MLNKAVQLTHDFFFFAMQPMDEELAAVEHADVLWEGNIKVDSQIYANDMDILSKSANGMQHLLNVAVNLMSKMHLLMNTSKSAVLVFGEDIPRDPIRWIDQPLLVLESYVYKDAEAFASGNSHLIKNRRIKLRKLKLRWNEFWELSKRMTWSMFCHFLNSGAR